MSVFVHFNYLKWFILLDHLLQALNIFYSDSKSSVSILHLFPKLLCWIANWALIIMSSFISNKYLKLNMSNLYSQCSHEICYVCSPVSLDGISILCLLIFEPLVSYLIPVIVSHLAIHPSENFSKYIQILTNFYHFHCNQQGSNDNHFTTGLLL